MRPPRLNPKLSVSVMFTVSMFVRMLDMTIVTVALPAISRDYHVDTVSASAVVVSYLLGLVIGIPAASWCGDRWGTKRVFVMGLVVFTLASAACGVSQNLPALTVFRLLQGLSGGLFGPVVMAMLMRTFPPEERIKASRVMTIPIAAAPLIGSVLGGFIADSLSWRWIFYINLPIGVAATLFAVWFLDDDGQRARNPFDVLGFLYAAGGLTLLMYGLNKSVDDGWTSALVLGCVIGGAVLLGLLCFTELRAAHPLLDLRVFGNHIFRISSGIILMITAFNAAYNFVFPLLYQNVFDRSALRVGIDIGPAAVGAIAGAQVAVKMYHRLGPRRHLLVSLTASFVGLALMALIDGGTQRWLVWLIMLYTGAVSAIAYNAAQTMSFATLTPTQVGVASSLFSTATQTGAALGVSLLSTILAGLGTTTGSGAPDLSTYQLGFVVTSGLAIVALLLTLRVRDSEAAGTLAPQPAKEAVPDVNPAP